MKAMSPFLAAVLLSGMLQSAHAAQPGTTDAPPLVDNPEELRAHRNVALRVHLTQRLGPVDDLNGDMEQLADLMKDMRSLQTDPKDQHNLDAKAVMVRGQLNVLRLTAERLALGFSGADEYVKPSGGKDDCDKLGTLYGQMIRDLEAQGRARHFAVEKLMPQFTQAQALITTIEKERDDTVGALIAKLG